VIVSLPSGEVPAVRIYSPLTGAVRAGWYAYELIEEIDPRSHSTYYTYDANGDLAMKTDRDERVTEYDYDDLGRLIEERWLDATGRCWSSRWENSDARRE
jgi:YD repeat-containing protein